MAGRVALGRLLQHPRRARHALDATGDHDVGVADRHGAAGGDDRFEPGAAQPIHRRPRDRRRQARQHHRHPGDVAVVLAGLVGVAEVRLVDRGRIEVGGPFDHRAHRGRGQVVGPNAGERAADPADRGADGVDDVALVAHAGHPPISICRSDAHRFDVRWSLTVERALEQAEQPGFVDRPGVVGDLGRSPRRRLGELVALEAERGQRRRDVRRRRQVPQAPCRILAGRPERLGEARHLGRQGRCVERDGMREHDRVRIGVDEVERAAEHVRDLVVQPGRRGGEGDARQVGAVHQLRPRFEVARFRHHPRQRGGDRPHTLERQRGRHRVGLLDPQRLDRVGERVARARSGDARRQAERELGVVDHGLREHDQVAAGLLVPSAGEPVDRGLLAPRVRRRHGDDRQPGVSAIALASPVDEPPPTVTTTSAPASATAARARSASSTGTCCTTSSQRAATSASSVPASSSAIALA